MRTELSNENLRAIGISAMYIASKFEDRYPITHDSLEKKVCMDQIPLAHVILTEQQIFSTLSFNLTFPTHMDFLDYHLKRIFENEASSDKYHQLRYYCVYVLKSILHSQENLEIDMEMLAWVILELALDCYIQVDQEFLLEASGEQLTKNAGKTMTDFDTNARILVQHLF
jgi:hypothetical protein